MRPSKNMRILDCVWRFLLFLLSVTSTVLCVYCHDEMMILHAPSALKFRGTDELNRSNLKNVLATALGYSVETSDEWNGLEVEKPFGFAKALLVLHFPGMDSFNSDTDSYYPIVPDEDLDETWIALKGKTERRFPDKYSVLNKVVLDDQLEVPTDGPVKSVNSSFPNSENDGMFIKELNKLHSVTDKLLSESNYKGKPDIFWVSAPRMNEIIAQRDENSKDALLNTLSTLSAKVKSHYNDKVLIVALTENKQESKRLKREITAIKPTLISLNVAADYDENFPVIFNIIFWFSLALLFAVIAICMVIGGMDPGRDSIIYRMTSTRMKKDN